MSFETRDIERHLIKLLVTNPLQARLYFVKIKESWLRTTRKIIFNIAREIFEETNSLLTDELLDVELDKRYPPTGNKVERDGIETEWEIIKQQEAFETPDALIQKLKEKETIGSVSSVCKKTLDLLKQGNISEAAETLKKESIKIDTIHEDKPLINFTDFEHRRKRIDEFLENPSAHQGILTGFKTFDMHTGGLHKAELTLCSAVSGCGKSTFLKMVGRNVVESGKTVLHITNEEHREQVEMKYDALFSEIDYFHFKDPRKLSKEFNDLENWERKMKEMRGGNFGKLFIKELPQFDTVASIYQVFIELEQQGHKPDIIIIDYIDHLSPVKDAWGENDEQAKVAHDCKGLALDFNIPVISVTQAATEVDKKQERGKKFGKMDVYGSKRKIHACNTFIGIMIGGWDESQEIDRGGDKACDKFLNCSVIKNRDGAPFIFECRHHVKIGKVTEEWWSDEHSGQGAKYVKLEEKCEIEEDDIELSESENELVQSISLDDFEEEKSSSSLADGILSKIKK